MIERVATCLENGGKHILRIPKQTFRTHRSLHSAFWSHGAGDIDLPAWWLAFLQVPSTHDQSWPSKENATAAPKAPPDGISLGLLDFLYPEKTLAFIRKCVSTNATAVRHRRRSQLLLQRSRAYTSAADTSVAVSIGQDDTAQNVSTEDAVKDVVSGQVAIGEEDRLTARFQQMISAKEQLPNGRELWQAYQEMRQASLSLSDRDLSRFSRLLSTSTKAFDLERTIDLFNDIPQERRNASHYKYAISAAIKQSDLSGAMAMHQEAASRIKGSNFGSSIIFKYAIQHSKWDKAQEIWSYYLNNQVIRFGQPILYIWNDINTLPISELMEQATRAVDFTIRRIKASSFDDASPMRNLAISLVQRALQARNMEFSTSLQLQMLRRTRHIQQPDLSMLKAAVLQNLSLGLQSSGHNNTALKLYRRIRADENLAPDLDLLMAIVKRFSALRDSPGMYEVLEDYRKHHEAPPRRAYPLLMGQFARHGDFVTVDELFREFVARYGNTEIASHARFLFYACFRRAETDRAGVLLQSLENMYGYVPDLQVWNLLLATYARVDDCDGAMSLFRKLIAAKISPESSTFGILMGMFAKRSDYEATTDLYEQARSTGIEPSFEMVDSLVLALVTGDRFDEAYQVAEEALTMDLEGFRRRPPYLAGNFPRTRMWNTLLAHCAMNGQLDKVANIQKRMHEAGVSFDNMTYAALMQSLCIKKMPGVAKRIMDLVMPKNGARPTPLHYSILMGGFITTNEPHRALQLASDMLEKNIVPTFSTKNNLLRIASKVDEQEYEQGNPKDYPLKARRAEEILAQTLHSLDPMELAPIGPNQRAQSNPVNVAFYASYFPYMISLYGKKGSFDRVVDMYDTYTSTAQKWNHGREPSPPVQLLSALMVAHTGAGEHAETEKCWHLALAKSETLARRVNADTAQPGWVLHRYRFILALPLTRYMQSLQATSRVDNIAATVAYLQHAGYQLSVQNWNKYIQILAQEGRSRQPFELCEKQLMDGWPGWEQFGSPIRAKRKIKKQWSPKSWERGRPFPHYETLVYLARVYMDVKSMPYGTGRELLQDLERVASRTMEAVLKMPSFDDEIQDNVLRGD
ncbi:MAG: hypothetical protein Q9166_007174 [cf. Caloplaca sp. 2 TL-2023]